LFVKDQNTPMEHHRQDDEDQNEKLLYSDASHVDILSYVQETLRFVCA
jgi:hypothetical protein